MQWTASAPTDRRGRNGMTDHFAEKSRNWDERPVPAQISQAVGRLLEALDWDASMCVMDFGAGTGLIAATIAPHVSRIVAVDTSPSMLEALAAKENLQGKVECRCQDILEAPLEERFDAVVSAMALHHVEDTGALVARFAEQLKPGGLLALADLDSEDGSFHEPGTEGVFHHGFDRRALQSILEAAGFDDVVFVTALEVEKDGKGPYSVFLVTARKA
jgi:2-polyprenyl-3-methyl-5-hydroxy-6-metoxy-1,4-benzoquinol methylase